MDDDTKNSVRAEIKEDYDNFDAMSMMYAYIFGPDAENNHFKVEEFQARYDELKADKQSIINEIESKLRGTYVISTDEETGENTYYSVTTRTQFLTDGTDGSYWTFEEVLDELQGELTWTALKESYEGE